jgi:hypothetical protein
MVCHFSRSEAITGVGYWKWCHPVPFPFLDTRSSNFTKGHVANQIQSIEKPENGSWEEKIQTRS